jgi:hypothetical protein
MSLPEMKKVPPGCETVEFGRHTYVCDPNLALERDQRAAVWGHVQYRPGGKVHRIATSGTYRPQPGDAAMGIVRLGNWCGRKRGWEEMAFPCPPNIAARVIATLVTPGKPRPRVDIDTQKFLARALRVGLQEIWLSV